MKRHIKTIMLVVVVVIFACSFAASAELKNLALQANGGVVTADSTFKNYTGPTVLNDGELNDEPEGDRWAIVAWASGKEQVDHWVEVALAKESDVSGVDIFWARDKDRWMMSSQIIVQYLKGEEWVDLWECVSTLETLNVKSTKITFATIKTSKIRILQPAMGGSLAMPNLLWLAEVQVWGE